MKPKFNFNDLVESQVQGNKCEFLVTHIKMLPQGTYVYRGSAELITQWVHESDLTKIFPSKKFYLYVKSETGYIYTTMMDENGFTLGGKRVDISNLIRLPVSADLPFDDNAERPHRKKKPTYTEDEDDEEDE